MFVVLFQSHWVINTNWSSIFTVCWHTTCLNILYCIKSGTDCFIWILIQILLCDIILSTLLTVFKKSNTTNSWRYLDIYCTRQKCNITRPYQWKAEETLLDPGFTIYLFEFIYIAVLVELSFVSCTRKLLTRSAKLLSNLNCMYIL